MTIKEVASPREIKDFLIFPVTLYKNDPNWIRPLDSDIEDIFNPEVNKFFRHGECSRVVF
jgi:hypothetical protein